MSEPVYTSSDLISQIEHMDKHYVALGRFVEAFEAMVEETRRSSVTLLTTNTEQTKWVSIPIYHQALTAKPLFEIFRGIMAQMVNDDVYRKLYPIDDNDVSAFMSVLSRLAGEYSSLANKRNDLLHGTWSIGNTIPLQEGMLQRRRVDKNGLSTPKDLPKDADELDALSRRCREARYWIVVLTGCMPSTLDTLDIKKSFAFEGDDWVRIWPSRGTLPKPTQ